MGLFKNNPPILSPKQKRYEESGLTCEADGQYDEGCHAFFIDEWNAAQTDPSKKVQSYAEYQASPEYKEYQVKVAAYQAKQPPTLKRQPPIAGNGPVTVTGRYSYPGAAKTKTAGAGLAMAAAAALIFFLR